MYIYILLTRLRGLLDSTGVGEGQGDVLLWLWRCPKTVEGSDEPAIQRERQTERTGTVEEEELCETRSFRCQIE